MSKFRKDDRDREELLGAEKNVFQDMLEKVTDFTMNLLGMGSSKGGESTGPSIPDLSGGSNQLLDKAKELSAKAVKTLVDGADSLLKSLKLDENEMIGKAQEQMKDYLRQAGLLEDDSFENEDYY
ncbi:MAG: hypothetical protein ACTSUE_15380 [Promethearchaeota archaeon]